MWAADIPHVNYLQFPSVDRLSFQEKLSRRDARLSGRKGFQGVPFLPNKGLPCPAHTRVEAAVSWGATPISPPGWEWGGTLPQPYPGRPLTLHEGICVSYGKPGRGRGQGWESGLQQQPGLEAVVGAWERGWSRAENSTCWALKVRFPTNLSSVLQSNAVRWGLLLPCPDVETRP